MEIQLDEKLLNLANNTSHYERGKHVLDSANYKYDKFVSYFDNKDYNNSQLQMLEKRKLVFKDFLTKSYNEYLGIMVNFIPITVSGPAGVNVKKNEKANRRMIDKLNDIDSKIDKFYENTEKMLKNLYSKTEILEKYRNGYDEPISSDDPMAKEKLEAKLEFLEKRHQKYKDFNKTARKNSEQQLPSYVLANSNQNIKSVKDRLELLDKMNNINISDYRFDDGEVKFDKSDMRVRIYYDEKPDEKTRHELKRNAFKWSPTNMAWQRKLTPDAIRTTKRMFNDIGKLEKSIEEKTMSM